MIVNKEWSHKQAKLACPNGNIVNYLSFSGVCGGEGSRKGEEGVETMGVGGLVGVLFAKGSESGSYCARGSGGRL